MAQQQAKQNLPAVRQPVVPVHPLLLSDAQWERLTIIAERTAKSGLLPKGMSPEAALVVMLKGNELGLQPMYALEQIAVINGKPTLSSQAMLRLVLERCPGFIVNYLTPVAKADTECEVEFIRPKQKPARFRFTMEDAKRANLLDKPGPWRQYPRMMLRWRAISEGLRIIAPDVLAGIYTPEELGAPVDAQGDVIDVKLTQGAPSSAAVVQAAAAEVPTPASSQAKGGEADNATSKSPASPPPLSTTEQSERAHSLGYASHEEQLDVCRAVSGHAESCGWTPEETLAHMDITYGKNSTKLLTKAQIEQLVRFLRANQNKREQA